MEDMSRQTWRVIFIEIKNKSEKQKIWDFFDR